MTLCFCFYYQLEQTWQIVLVAIFSGFHGFACPSNMIVYGSQIAFPVDQASIAGYLISISQAFGFVLGLILVPFVTQTRINSMVLFLVIGAVILLGALITPTIVEDLRKDKYEEGLLKSEEVEADFQGEVPRTEVHSIN
jgi:MFS family permease